MFGRYIIQAILTLLYFCTDGLVFLHEDVNRFIALNGQLESLRMWPTNGVNRWITNYSVTSTMFSKMNCKELNGTYSNADGLKVETYG